MGDGSACSIMPQISVVSQFELPVSIRTRRRHGCMAIRKTDIWSGIQSSQHAPYAIWIERVGIGIGVWE
jgi:hypothetical protein